MGGLSRFRKELPSLARTSVGPRVPLDTRAGRTSPAHRSPSSCNGIQKGDPDRLSRRLAAFSP